MASTLGASEVDVLELTNGDRISGQIIDEQENLLVLQNQWLGEVTILRTQIETLTRAESIAPVEAKPVEAPLTQETIEKLEALKVIEPTLEPESPAPEEILFEEGPILAEESPPEDTDLALGPHLWWKYFSTWWNENEFLKPWDTRISLGASLEKGQTDSYGVNLRFQTQRKFKSSDLRLDWRYDYGRRTVNGISQTDKDRHSLRSRYRHNINKERQFFVESETRYHEDRIRRIDFELEQSLGIGYRLVDNDKLEVSLTPSLATERRDLDGVEGEWQPEAAFSQNLQWQINPIFSATQDFRYQIDLDDSELYEITSNVRFDADLTETVSLNLSYEYDQDKDVRPGIDPVTTKTIMGLGVRF